MFAIPFHSLRILASLLPSLGVGLHPVANKSTRPTPAQVFASKPLPHIPPADFTISCQESIVEFMPGWEMELIRAIADIGPACQVTDKFGTKMAIRNGKTCGIPSPDRLPLVAKRRLVNDRDVKDGVDPSTISSPPSVGTAETPSPKGRG